MANLYTKQVIVGMIYVVHIVKRNKIHSVVICWTVSLKSKELFCHVDVIRVGLTFYAHVWFNMSATRQPVC